MIASYNEIHFLTLFLISFTKIAKPNKWTSLFFVGLN